MKEIKAKLSSGNLKIAIVVADFNSFITSELVGGALGKLAKHGISSEKITIVHVPGAFEIPFMAMQIAKEGLADGIICIGAVIKGATSHFDFVAGECAKGVMNVGLQTGVPTVFCVLTTDTIEQAIERAGTKAGNLGASYAESCLDLISVKNQL